MPKQTKPTAKRATKRPTKRPVKKASIQRESVSLDSVVNDLSHLEYRSVRPKDVKPHPNNPRVGDLKKIKKSIEINGFISPIIVHKSTNQVLAGNHRRMAAIELGKELIPAIIVDVDDKTASAYMLADNKAGDGATYDEKALATFLGDLTSTYGDDALAGTVYGKAEAEKIKVRAEWQDDEDYQVDDEGVSYDGQEATNTFKLAQPKERVKELDELSRRSLILSIPVRTHKQFRDALEAAREHYGTDTNEETVVAMLKEGGYLKKKIQLIPKKAEK